MEKILGQNHAVKILQAVVNSGKVHHAWIFHGPLGVGKFTTAIELAKLLLDPEVQPDLSGLLRSDDQNKVARMIEADAHPDLHVIRKELALTSIDSVTRNKKLTNIPIAVIREHMIGGNVGDKFIDSIAYTTASMNHCKVFIIEEAELMDKTSQNAILKTLEEPPVGTYIILITTQPDKLFPTVRSRCQRVPFVSIDADSMSKWFTRAELDIDSETKAWLEEFADGSPGMVLLALEDNLYQWHKRLLPMLREIEAGSFPYRMGAVLAEFVDEYATSYVKRNVNASKDMANKGGAKRVFMLLASFARKGLHRCTSADEDAEQWLEMIDAIHDSESSLNRNVNMKLVFENLVAQWSDITSLTAVT